MTLMQKIQLKWCNTNLVMDLKLRKILRDFITWQGHNDLLKDPLTIDYEVAETYLEETKKDLKLYGINKSFSWGEVEEFGRNAFYKGREFSELKDLNNGIPYFKRPTYNEYLREMGYD